MTRRGAPLTRRGAPRDGRWILIQYDHNDGSEYWHVARWKPYGNYEWQFIDWDGTVNYLSDGRVCSWKPLPT